jgi:DNA-binding response OmpR family regulator
MAMTQIRTLVVDDEESIRFFLTKTLELDGHVVAMATSGENALDQLRESPFDLVMLDLRLGGRVDGIRVLEAVKWRWPETAVVILTAYGSLESALAAIREGVDGYLLKPVEPGELRHVVRDVLARRAGQNAAGGREEKTHSHVLKSAGLSVDLDKRQVTVDGQPVELTPREFNLLVHLTRNAHRVIPPVELVHAVTGYDCDDENEARGVIRWYVHRLRRKVEPDPASPRYILNVRGVGYTFGGE